MLVRIQTQTNMPGQGLALLLREHGVDLPGRAPYGAAVFLAVPALVPVGEVQTHAEDIDPGGEQKGYGTLFCPRNIKRRIQRRRQVLYEDGQASFAKAFRQHQRQPCNGNVKKNAQENIARPRVVMEDKNHLFSQEIPA